MYDFRYNKNQDKAKEVSGKLKDNRELQHFLQNTQDVSNTLLNFHWQDLTALLLIKCFCDIFSHSINIYFSLLAYTVDK